jgi:tRNA(Ile)-lysidine synthase
MDRLGPFEPNPTLAIAVSGGADSMALAILVRDWLRPRGGSAVALVVDHGLRAASADEAGLTIARLSALGLAARRLTLTTLSRGPALAERARIMRYDVLTRACAEAGILHLLLGHHAADQVETLAMRVLRGSQTHGLAGMAAVRETGPLRLLRPLLTIEPVRLRDFLTAAGVDWVEDPSNQDLQALRPRLRHGFATASIAGTGLPEALAAAGRLRQREEAATAAELAERATIRPEGFALLSPGRIGTAALSALIRTIGGAAYPSSPAQIAELAAQPKPATLAGVRILPAGRMGEGFLLVREEAAIAAAMPARQGAIWDHRFRLMTDPDCPGDALISRLGPDAARFRRSSHLPSVVLRTLPAIRSGKTLAFVPHLGYGCQENDMRAIMLFAPEKPVAGACFLPQA